MTNTELLNAIDSRIANLQMSTAKVSKMTQDTEEYLMCLSREIAYQECRNIVLSVLGEAEEC